METPPILELKPGAPPAVRRRGRRILQIAILAVVVIAAPVVWRFYRHMAATAFFASNGARVTWRWTLDDGRNEPGTTVVFGPRYTTLSPADFAHLKDLYKLRALDLSRYSGVPAQSLRMLPEFETLKELHLSRQPPPNFSRNPKANNYTDELLGPVITDADTEWLSRMTGLEILSLEGSAITDAGLEKLQSLKQLDTLDLTLTKITDAGLARLKDLPRLRYVYLDRTGVSCEAVAALVQARPNLVVMLPRCEEGYDPRTMSDAP